MYMHAYAVSLGHYSMLYQISDHLWYDGLPFSGIVPWPDITFTILQSEISASALEAIVYKTPADMLDTKRRLLARHVDDVSWTSNTSTVFENILITAVHSCLV
jgi:hypothetical protein